ncbi:MAG: hypothetical protein H0W99_14665 [Acidobacteria bacterium]|nr:hypothetical protein [Acidobacteriota bacterium]
MKQLTAPALFDSLRQLPDPCLDRPKRQALVDVLVSAVCAIMCGAESGDEMG